MVHRRILLGALLVLCSHTARAETIYGFYIDKIEGVDIELDERFGTTASATEHKVNYQDCLNYLGLDPGQSLGTEGEGAEVIEPDAVEAVEVVEVIQAVDAAGETASDVTEASSDASGGGGGASATAGPGKIAIDWVVRDQRLTGKWWYSIRIGSCTEDVEVDSAATDTCTYLRQKTELTPYSTDTIEIPVKRLLGTECAKGSEGDVRLYFTIQSDFNNQDHATSTVTIDYDYEAPKTVTSLALEAGEENLNASWDDMTDTSAETVTYKVYWYDASFDDDTLADDAAREALSSKGDLTTNSYRITGLELGETYWVGVVALDDFDNESPLSEVLDGTPILVTDGFERYKQVGGAEKGGFGCSVGEGSAATASTLLLLGVALAAALASARRRGARRGA
jgi:hypothetical protein